MTRPAALAPVSLLALAGLVLNGTAHAAGSRTMVGPLQAHGVEGSSGRFSSGPVPASSPLSPVAFADGVALPGGQGKTWLNRHTGEPTETLRIQLTALPGHAPALRRFRPPSSGVPAFRAPRGRDLRTQADSLIRLFMVRHRLPAISVAVADSTGFVYRRAFGLADVENRVPATPETAFRVASLTKPLTGAGILRLADTGRLDLDAPIHRYCPAFPARPSAPTARLLLAHLGGLGDYTRVEQGVWKVLTRGGTQEGSNTVYLATLADAVAVFATDTLQNEPGTRFRYSNLGYVLLGCAIEGASAQRYADFMAQEVLRPLGMTRTLPNDAYAIIENRARPYQMRTEETADWWWFIPAQKQVMELGRLYNARFEDTSHKLPAGGMLSTPSDLVRFAQQVIGGDFLSAEVRTAMLTEQRTRSGEGTGWGLGWLLDDGVVGMNGGQPGASASLSMIPAASFAVAIVTNRDLVPTDDLFHELSEIWGYGAPR